VLHAFPAWRAPASAAGRVLLLVLGGYSIALAPVIIIVL
jgi:hypothetical protein